MNIFKMELKQGFKAFFFWTCGIAFLLLVGMMKFSGVQGSENGSISALMAGIPKPVLAMFGMAEANVETLAGFFFILQFYALLVLCCYAVHLGTSCVLRENMDKTYEFLFTKPCGRLRILSTKMCAGLCYLVLITFLNTVFSYLSPGLYGIENTIAGTMFLYPIATFLVCLLFFSLSMAISALSSRSERAVQISNGILLLAYALSVLFDMDTKFEVLRFATPLKYFRAAELEAGDLNIFFAVAVALLFAIFTIIAFQAFKKKDLAAV